MSARAAVSIALLLAMPAAAASGGSPPSGSEYVQLDSRFFHHWVGSIESARSFVTPGDGSAVWVAVLRDVLVDTGDELRFVARATSDDLSFEREEAVDVRNLSGPSVSAAFTFLELPFAAPEYGRHRYRVDVEVLSRSGGEDTSLASASATGDFWFSPVPGWAFVVVAVLAILAIPGVGILRRRFRGP